jgi:ubiquinone/menaquinone biosynthesis C-methylase UbiE
MPERLLARNIDPKGPRGIPRRGLYDWPMDGSSTTPASTLDGGRESAADPELATALAAFTNLDYRDRFWPGREYEDQCDRIALRALLPATGGRLMDVGAGFGRLADEYGGYREVVLVDPSDALLDSARERLGSDPRFTFLSGTAQHLPVADASVDAVVCVRVLHHVGDLRPAIAEFARILRPGGVLVMETANKRNLKAILAWLMRRRRSSPFRRGSERYVDISLLAHRGGSEATAPGHWTSSISYLHSPRDVCAWLAAAGFEGRRVRTAALLRPSVVTRHVPGRLLVRLERILQPSLAALTPGPSLFVAGRRRRGAGEGVATRPSGSAR